MGGKNSSNYIMGGVQTAAGAALSAFGAPEVGIPLMTSGIGEVAGQAGGGSRGAAMGQGIGAAVGGLGSGGMGLAGMSGMGPLANTLSAAPALQNVAQNPAVSAIPAQSVNLPSGGTMQLPALPGGQQPLMGESAASLMTQDYPLATRLDAIPQFGGGNTGGSGSGGIMDFLKSPGGSQMASSLMQGMNQPPTPPGQPPQPPQLRPQVPGQPTPPPQPAVANVPKPPSAPSAGGDPTQMLAMLKRMLGGSGGLA